jgi:hypothetical protein
MPTGDVRAPTRDHQPTRFWKYIFEGYAFLALCVIAFFSVLLWPDFFHK